MGISKGGRNNHAEADGIWISITVGIRKYGTAFKEVSNVN
jgi:hypothetical protein